MNPEFGNLEQPHSGYDPIRRVTHTRWGPVSDAEKHAGIPRHWCDQHQTYHAEAKCPEPGCTVCGARELAHTDIRDGQRGHAIHRPQDQRLHGVWHAFTTRPISVPPDVDQVCPRCMACPCYCNIAQPTTRYGGIEFESSTHWKKATAAEQRKQQPLATGCLDYFPDALLAVANCSYVGNEQHNPGQPLHWDRSKSTDEADAMMRHFRERGKVDTDGVRHSAKAAWRCLALLQKEIEAAR